MFVRRIACSNLTSRFRVHKWRCFLARVLITCVISQFRKMEIVRKHLKKLDYIFILQRRLVSLCSSHPYTSITHFGLQTFYNVFFILNYGNQKEHQKRKNLNKKVLFRQLSKIFSFHRLSLSVSVSLSHRMTT